MSDGCDGPPWGSVGLHQPGLGGCGSCAGDAHVPESSRAAWTGRGGDWKHASSPKADAWCCTPTSALFPGQGQSPAQTRCQEEKTHLSLSVLCVLIPAQNEGSDLLGSWEQYLLMAPPRQTHPNSHLCPHPWSPSPLPARHGPWVKDTALPLGACLRWPIHIDGVRREQVKA